MSGSLPWEAIRAQGGGEGWNRRGPEGSAREVEAVRGDGGVDGQPQVAAGTSDAE